MTCTYQGPICRKGHDKRLVGTTTSNGCRLCYQEYMKAYKQTEEYKVYHRGYQKKFRLTDWYKQYQKSAVAKAAQKAYRVAHPELYKMFHSVCKANRKLRMVKFGQDGIRKFYKNCPARMVVDHVIPLQGKQVSGLHVIWNLQYLTPAQNMSKGNKIWPQAR